MDKRTTIKVNRDTKQRFDKLHKELELKNHDVTLNRLMDEAKNVR